jgi:hypothetical protein
MQIPFTRRSAIQLLALPPALGFKSSVAAKTWEVRIVRTSVNASCLTGELFIDGKFLCHCLELPWRNNKSYISAIPDGKYAADLRYDKPDKWRVQLKNVPGRTGVQLHVGNYPTQIEGCVLVGQKVFTRQNKLEGSNTAYLRLRETFYGSADPIATPDVTIQAKVEYGIGRTEFTAGDVTLKYQDEGRWAIANINFKELFRDLGHIYMKPDDETSVFMRIPLFGGHGDVSQNISGPWTRQDGPPFKRKN